MKGGNLKMSELTYSTKIAGSSYMGRSIPSFHMPSLRKRRNGRNLELWRGILSR